MFAKISVKKPYTVIVGIILVIVLGVISFMNMTTDLLPSMDLPYVIVYTTYTGATPERVEADVTRPLEAAFATLTDVKNVSSTSSENLSLVVLEFEAAADMNTAMIEMTTEVDQLSAGWDDAIGAPVIMKLNPDMLPVTMSTVALEGADLYELSEYVEETLVPRYESVDGVARVTASGILTQQVDITIEQSRIDALNSAILREVDDELADVEAELREARRQIRSGKGQLSRMRKSTFAQIDEGLAAIEAGSAQMPAAIAALEQQKAELTLQLEGAKAALAQLEGLVNMSEEEKAQLNQLAETLAQLETQRNELQTQLDNLGEALPSDALAQQLADAQKARDEQAALKASQEKYIADLKLLDADALRETIARLEGEMAVNEAELSAVRGNLETAITTRDEAQREINDLTRRIADLEAALVTPIPEPTAEPTPEVTSAPTAEATAEPAAEATAEPAADATAETTDVPSDENTAGSTAETTEEVTAEPTMAVADDATAVPETESVSEETQAPATEAPAEEPQAPATEAPAAENTAEETQAPVNEAPAADAPAPVQEETQLARFSFGGIALAEDSGETLEELKSRLAAAQAIFDAAARDVETLSARHDALRETLTAQDASLQEAKDALLLLDDGEITVQSRIEEAQKQIDACNRRIAELDEEIARLTAAIENGGAKESLAAGIAQLDIQIAAIKDSDAYKAYLMVSGGSAASQYAQAQAAVAQLEAGIAQMDAMLAKLNQGILPGGMIEGVAEDTNLAEARQQLLEARDMASSGFAQASSALREGEDKLAEAWAEFEEGRDEALENAGIDGIVTVETISAILGSQNLDLPAGYVSNADDRYLVSVGREFASLAELKQVKLFSLGLETVDDVRLLDVADVAVSDNSADLFTLVNGENGIMLSFEKQSTASTAEVAKNITAESERLMAEVDGLEVVEMMNQGDYIDLIVSSVLDNLVSGGILAIAILLLFLLDWRPTLIVAISIPTSVVIAFVCMYFSGITLNVMSLSGLALGVGMLVDNSIVAIDNIYRLRNEEKLPLLTACIRGVNQVGGALFASTLTTICVFLPVVFIQGMARDLFSDMGLAIAFSLLASLLVAMTVVPSFAATLFRKAKTREPKLFVYLQRFYVWLLKGALKVRLLVLLLALGLLAWTVMQVPNMGISFMPSVNSSQMSASIGFNDPEISDDDRQAMALEIMDRIIAIEGVTDVSLSGSDNSMMSMMAGGGGYSYYVLVDEAGLRSNAQIASDMRSAAAEYADGENVVFTVQESTMDLSAMAGSGITINITGEDIPTLRTAAVEVAALCQQVEGAENIDDGASETEPKLIVTVDKELASDNSLSVAQVYQYIAQRLYGPIKLTEATLDGQDYTIYVSEDRNENLSPADVEEMEIEVSSTGSKKFVRIGDIAEITEGESLSGINRNNQKRQVTVSFAVANGYSSNHVQANLEEKLAAYQPPEGCNIAIAGENETVMGYMEDLGLMLVVAVVFIILIMVAQFQSFKSPIIVMFTIPLAFTGGLAALLITKMDLSLVAMVGFLVLSGVVVNNGIVFIDSVNQMRIGGMTKREALLETGRIRLRPILMTALTTILGMSTMAFAQGMGAEMMQPMAVVTIGGLTYATLMTLFVVPVLYDLINGQKMKAREIEMMKEAAGMRREGFDDDAPVAPVQPDTAKIESASQTNVPAAPAVFERKPAEADPVQPAEASVPAKPDRSNDPRYDRSRRVKIRF